MTGRERIRLILDGKEADRSGFWLGHPHEDALKLYKKYFGVRTEEELAHKIGSDLMWVCAIDRYYLPRLKPFLNTSSAHKRHSTADALVKNIETLEDLEALNWSQRKKWLFILFEKHLRDAERHDMAVFSGCQTAFCHKVMEFFGMEECFIKMYENPELVEKVAENYVNFFYNANEALFNKYGHRIDCAIYFNDLGTQLDTLISLDMFRQFFLPGFKKLTDQAHRHKIKICVHSCGAIDRFIPDLINVGVDVLHPIQAKARNMDAQHLQSAYGGKITFCGGVDTQELLPFGTVDDVANEVKRLRGIFGNRFILSPSHEALLDNVSAQKVEAMAREATRIF